jgi:hypothetical protein
MAALVSEAFTAPEKLDRRVSEMLVHCLPTRGQSTMFEKP